MKVSCVVYNFPVLSETFIIRQIENLVDDKDIDLFIVVIDNYDEVSLRNASPKIYSLVKANKIKVIFDPRFSRKKVLGKAFSYIRVLLSGGVPAIKLLWEGRASGMDVKKILFTLRVYRLFSKVGKVDVVHAQFLNLLPQLSLLSKAKLFDGHSKLFCSVRGADIGVKRHISSRDLTDTRKLKIKLICVSESLQRMCISGGVSRDDTAVIYSGLDTREMQYVPPSKRDRAVVTFIQVGRLVEKKGFDLSIRAMSRLINIGVNCHLLVVGDGPLRSYLETRAKELGLFSQINFMGGIGNADVIRLLSSCNALLVPSKTGRDGDQEGIPNVAKEAMAVGCIVIASNHSGLPELVQSGHSGFVFQEEDSQQLSNCMQNVVREAIDLDQMAYNASQYVRSEFDSSVTTKKLISLYEKVLFHDEQRRFSK